MNLPVEQILSSLTDVEQRSWDAYLDFVMYVLNNSKSDSTGETPNFLSWGRRALEPLDLLLGVDPDPVMSREHWLDRLASARRMAARHNEEANARMKQQADAGKLPHDLKVGDTVWVEEKRVPPGISAKLRPKSADTEYRVESLSGAGQKSAEVVSVTNELDRRQLHVDRLKRVAQEPTELFGEPVPAVASESAEAGEAEQFEVERILDRRVRKGKVSYFVRWRGYGPQDDRWVAEADLSADEKVREFERHEASRQLAPKSSPLSYVDAAKKGARVPAQPRRNPTRKSKKAGQISIH
jgi:hypothetical protein